jgi:hypothetical protein
MIQSREERLSARTIKIIEKHGNILLKTEDGYYLSCWTNIAAGPDHACFSMRETALEIFSLQWAFAIAPLYKCKVVVFYPERVKR